ncbi:MAG TPA: hypothetical protein VK034_15320 [Enhygromyxa sp.]|nr:hypothetical protein [Enhygromyxa sp.]
MLACLLTACDKADQSNTKATSNTATEPAKDPGPTLDREAWASTCAESLIPTGPLPPLPPPWSLPEHPPSKIATPTEPKPVPAPRLVPLARPNGSELATRVGLKPDACDPTPLLALLDQHSKDESLHCAIAFAFEQCGQLDQALVWLERRAADFPASADARLALGWWRFASLLPDPQKGLPFNDQLSYPERMAIASAVVADAEAALSLRPNDVAAHRLAVLAHAQKQLAREVVSVPETVEDQLEILASRKDAMAAYIHKDAEARARGVPECTDDSVVDCRASLRLLEEDMAGDAELEAQLREQLEAQRHGK